MWLILLLAAPLAIVLVIAFALPADGVPPFSVGFTLDNLRLVVSDPLYRDALLRSFRVAGVSTLICLAMGFPVALAIARAAPRWQNVALLAIMLPFWTGFLMRINAWIGLLADDGLIVRLLGVSHLLYTDTAMYIGIVYTYLPFMVLPLYAQAVAVGPGLDGGGRRSGRAAMAGFPAGDPAAVLAGGGRRRGAGVRSGASAST